MLSFCTENTPVTNPPVSSTTGTAVGVTVGVISIALIVVFALGLFFWSKKNKNRNGK